MWPRWFSVVPSALRWLREIVEAEDIGKKIGELRAVMQGAKEK